MPRIKHEPVHSPQECTVCDLKPTYYSANSHRKVPAGLPAPLEELLLLHVPSIYRACAECHSNWPCDTNRIIHRHLKEERDGSVLPAGAV